MARRLMMKKRDDGDNGGSGLRAYRIRRNGVTVKWAFAPASSWSDAGLAESTSYTYRVSARDNAGNESAAAVQNVTTIGC